MHVLGIIPARGGSKGVPGKNIKIVGGKPLIGYTIATALASHLFENIIVSSDDEAILNYAASQKITTHQRSAALATDESPVVLTVLEVLHFAENLFEKKYDAVMLLQPTSPLREPWHLKDAVDLLAQHPESMSVISVTKSADLHPARMYNIEDGHLFSLQPEYEQANRQQLPAVYLRNGSVYLVRRDALLKDLQIMIHPSLAYIMDSKYHLNIDEPRDMLLAEVILSE
jgi:CMP-N,N'-diacetyllegionaminic acid synthase